MKTRMSMANLADLAKDVGPEVAVRFIGASEAFEAHPPLTASHGELRPR